MPDRLPPRWGHEPEDGRDLDALLSVEETLSVEEMLTDEALLSGQLAGLSERQRPVAGAMFALRAAPAGSELAGEAAARAAFRALVVPAVRLPSSAVPAGIFPAGAAWSLGDSGGAELQHTLVLPVPAAGQGPRPPARHRHRRRAAGRPGWPVIALLGSAAAVVAVGAAAIAGTFSGSAGHQGQSADPSAARMSPQAGVSASGTQRVLGRGLATKDPTSSATPKASAAPGATAGSGPGSTLGPDTLCRQYFEFLFDHSPGSGTNEQAVFEQLSQLAHSDSPRSVIRYCAEQLGHQWWAPSSWPTPSGGAGFPYPGSGGGDGRQDTGAGPGQARYGAGDGGPGDSGSR